MDFEKMDIVAYLDTAYGWTVKLSYKTTHFSDKAAAVANGQAMAKKLGCKLEVK